ncbi:MAG: MgtC/SapB family protein [bacterium]|nr:MgtC/SapB family protein [bacterium]
MDWNAELFVRLAAAALLGGLIGLEREKMNRAAGLRTHIMVSLGSALFTILSLYAFREPGKVNDPARIAAQIVSGIGFLGAGTIMKHGATVRGLTTAATLWVVAAIGMAAGAGFYACATVTSVTALITLVSLRGLERTIGGKTLTVIEMTLPKTPGGLSKLYSSLELLGLRVRNLESEEDENNINITAEVIMSSNIPKTLIVQTLKDSGVTSIDIN